MSDRLRHNENRKPRKRSLTPLQMKQRIEELRWVVRALAPCCEDADYRTTPFADVDGVCDIWCASCGTVLGLTYRGRRATLGA